MKHFPNQKKSEYDIDTVDVPVQGRIDGVTVDLLVEIKKG
jgi:hypothetical protein